MQGSIHKTKTWEMFKDLRDVGLGMCKQLYRDLREDRTWGFVCVEFIVLR